MLLSEHKKANIFNAKRDIGRGGVPATSIRCPDHTIPDYRLFLSIQL